MLRCVSCYSLVQTSLSQGHDGLVTLCRYPFVFDAQAKTTLLQTDAVLQMQVKYIMYKCVVVVFLFFY